MDGYMAFLLVGVVLVLIDGQLIYRGGRGYLQQVYEPEAAQSMIQLVTVLFHLVVLGLLALISLIRIDTGLPVRDLVVKLGVLLLVLAASHGLTIAILMKIRNRRRQERITDEIADNLHQRGARDAVVKPVAETENTRTHPETRW